MSTLSDAIQAIRNGQTDEGRQILEQILETEENNEQVWLWLSAVVDSDEDREICLENVLAINPDNIMAQRGLDAMRAGVFNPQDIIGEMIEAQGEAAGGPLEARSFHDEFFASVEEESLGTEIEWPSVMGGAPEPIIKAKAEQQSKDGSKLPIRIILIVVVGLCVVLGLGSAAAYNLFLAGGNDSEGTTPVEQPVEGTPTPEADVDTPTPAPSPTPTETVFVLPTARPTDEPSPTPTTVVSPTPEGG